VRLLLVAAAIALSYASGHSPRASARSAAVAPPIVAGPASARATVVLVHQGGWAGPNAELQRQLDAFPGRELRRRGYRTVSIDYARGKAGLSSVLQQVTALRRSGAATPLCLYGESAGGNLALLAAARDRRIRCVMTVGAPTDFIAWRRDAIRRVRDPTVNPALPRERRPVSLAVFRQTVVPTFGSPGPRTRRWEPARQASRIHARVVLAQQRDDFVLPLGQLKAFTRRSTGARSFVLGSGSPAEGYLHGTLSSSGRRLLVRRLTQLLNARSRPG